MDRKIAIEILKELIKNDLVMPDTEVQVLNIIIAKIMDYEEKTGVKK